MMPDDPIYWSAFRRLRERIPAYLHPWEEAEREPDRDHEYHDDLAYILSKSEEVWRRMRNLERKAAAYDAMCDAYERTPGKPQAKQRAACRAGGLTGAGAAHEKFAVVERWFALVRENGHDRYVALDKLAAEHGLHPDDMARVLVALNVAERRAIETAAGDVPLAVWFRELGLRAARRRAK